MVIREWNNGLTASSIVVAVGLVITTEGGWKLDDWYFWICLAATLGAAFLVIILLRPSTDEYQIPEQLRML